MLSISAQLLDHRCEYDELFKYIKQSSSIIFMDGNTMYFSHSRFVVDYVDAEVIPCE